MPNICPICNKKSNQLGIICKCGNKYCMNHRMPEDHHCIYDYKSEAQQHILKILTSSKYPKFI